MPRLVSETLGVGDQSWLGSTHGIYNCRTVTIKRSTLTESTDYPNGYVKSGFPLAIVSGKAVKYNKSASDGSQTLAGFLYADVSTAGTEDIPAALFWHGSVRVDKLPVSFDPTDADYKTSGLFSFTGEAA